MQMNTQDEGNKETKVNVYAERTEDEYRREWCLKCNRDGVTEMYKQNNDFLNLQ